MVMAVVLIDRGSITHSQAQLFRLVLRTLDHLVAVFPCPPRLGKCCSLVSGRQDDHLTPSSANDDTDSSQPQHTAVERPPLVSKLTKATV